MVNVIELIRAIGKGATSLNSAPECFKGVPTLLGVGHLYHSGI